jgi:hypothetical protein
MKKTITRRDFMRKSAYAVLGTAVGISSLHSQTPVKKSRVVLIRHANAMDENFKIDETIVQQMLDKAVMTLFEGDDPVKTFKTIVKPDDIVGIKSNVWAYLPTPPEVEKAIKRRVLDAGVKAGNIAIDDRGVRNNPVFQKSTALINVRPLRTHYLAGISGCMKNFVTFSENIPGYHPENCSRLATLFDLPQVKGKTRLHVLCVLTPQFYGRGPHHFNRRYVWNYKGIIVGTDPVAVDAVGFKIIMAKHRDYFAGEKPLLTMPRHIRAADAEHGLGNCDFNKIDLITLGWKEGMLI